MQQLFQKKQQGEELCCKYDTIECSPIKTQRIPWPYIFANVQITHLAAQKLNI
jgi:hypothetical protein